MPGIVMRVGAVVKDYVGLCRSSTICTNHYRRPTMLSRRLIPRLNRSLKFLTRSASSSSSSSVPSKPQPSVPAPQAPNYPTAWSTNQQTRAAAASNPRFEQTVIELQPNPLSAMELVANEPVRLVHGRKAVCDGGERSIDWVQKLAFNLLAGGGPLGHPKIFINLVRCSQCLDDTIC